MSELSTHRVRVLAGVVDHVSNNLQAAQEQVRQRAAETPSKRPRVAHKDPIAVVNTLRSILRTHMRYGLCRQGDTESLHKFKHLTVPLGPILQSVKNGAATPRIGRPCERLGNEFLQPSTPEDSDMESIGSEHTFQPSSSGESDSESSSSVSSSSS